MSSPGKRISVAVAGLGVIARTVHLPLLERRRDLFQVAAVADLSMSTVDELGDRYAVPAAARYTDASAMLAGGGFDAVLLLTSGSHGDLAAEAMRRGTPVFCEKPLAYTRAEAAQLAALAGSAGVMVGYMKQYDPAVTRAARMLDELGGAAAVHAVDVTVLHPSEDSQLAFAHLPPPQPPADALDAVRRRDRELVGAAVDAAAPAQALYRILVGSVCHELSLLRLFTGSPATVDYVTTWPAAPPKGREPSVEVSGELPGGGRYGIRWHYLPDQPAYRETVTVYHAHGSLELVFPSPYLLHAPTTLTTVDHVNDAGGERRAAHRSVVGSFERELEAFHAMVTTGAAPLTGLAGGLEDIVTSQRIVRRFGELAGMPVGGEAGKA